MGDDALRRRLHAAAAVLLAGLVAACGGNPQTAAPVVLKGAGAEAVEAAPLPPRIAAHAPPSRPASHPPATGAAANPPRSGPGRRIVVERGQSVSILARDYHVSQRAIIEANRLPPPYKIEIGQQLVIPGAAEPAPVQTAAARSPAPPERPGEPPKTETAATSPRPAPESSAATRRGGGKPEIIPLDGPAQTPTRSARPPAISFPPPAASGSAKPPPDPAPAAAKNAPAADEDEAAPARGGHLLWPVRGRILAGYGATKQGGHNSGINIAATRGAPVKAVDAGVVAYAGNEIRGYGNLILVKHASGFISAYAHCDELLVKRGDKVGRGQVIAKVGATGGVAEPQLHFELRRGKRAVDPREFLAPATSAGSAEDRKRG
jgi:murein DD-endopeptidase MepM/ murein hydrolase activator NlpD